MKRYLRTAHWGTLARVATFILLGCGGGSSGSSMATGPNPPPPPPAPVQTNTIRLTSSGGNRFSPANIEVPAGTTVTFIWESGTHTLTSSGSPSFQGIDDAVSAPSSLPVTFTQPGTYNFFCSIHGSPTGGMRGSVTVR